MRVLVYSLPRTCSSYVIHIVSDVLKLENYNELYDSSIQVQDLHSVVEEKLYNTDNYAVKFMTNYFRNDWLDFENINWDIFDHIIFTERESIADQLCSWYLIQNSKKDLASKVYKNEKVISKIEDDYFVKKVPVLKEIILHYKNSKHKLLETYGHKCITLKHEMFQQKPEDYIDELNRLTNFNFTLENLFDRYYNVSYSEMFINYDRLKNEVYEWESSV